MSGFAVGQNKYRFDHITKKDGLSQGTINAIFEDKYGLMWFGTKDGLNLYDGNEIKVFRKNFQDPFSLPNNHILAINQDDNSRLWIGTSGNNLCYYNPVTDQFYPWQHLLNMGDSIDIGFNVYCINIDRKNQKLYAGSEKGILQIDLKNLTHDFIPMATYSSDGILAGNIYSLLSEADTLWVGTDLGGLIKHDLNTGVSHTIGYDHTRTNQHAAINKGTVMGLVKDRKGQIFVATFGDFVLKVDRQNLMLSRIAIKDFNPDHRDLAYTRQIALVGDTSIWATSEYGFQVLNLNQKELHQIKFDPDDPGGINSNGLKSIYADSHGGVWIGGNGFGLNYYFPVNKGFKHLRYDPSHSKSLDFKSVRSIYVNNEDQLFVGGYGGVNAFDKKGKKIWSNPDLHVGYVMLPHSNDKNLIWLGKEGGGLFLIDKRTGNLAIDVYAKMNAKNQQIFGSMVMCLTYKNNNELWIGTESGLNLLKTDNYEVIFYSHDPSDKVSVPNGRIKEIYKDSKERTWLATIGGGVAYMKNDDMLFRSFTHNPKDQKSISSNNVFCIHETESGEIYLGTESGLNHFEETTQTFTKLNTSNGLANDVVYRIESDAQNRMWISTNEGISCYDPYTKTFRNYDKEDGLQENEFNSGASFKDYHGNLYFGGINGVSIFDPETLTDNVDPPKVIFTNLLIGNKKALIDPPIMKAKNVYLSYDNQAFKLEFTALNFYKPKKNQYAYRIREISEDWHYLGNSNSIEIMRLGFGTYTIEVLASNNDNYWSAKPAQLNLHIAPPFWASTWFILSSIATLSFILIFIYRSRLSSLKKKKAVLEKEVCIRTKELQQTNEKLKSEIMIRQQTEEELKIANNTKDRFFSIIAHDLKNPFGVLFGLTEILNLEYDQLSDEEKKEMISAMTSSAADNVKLLENLLNWARTQQKRLEINTEKIDLYELVLENVGFLAEQAKAKQIDINIELTAKTIVLADYQTTSTVIRNLLSNAIKFTHPGGTIIIDKNVSTETVTLNIKDSGVGIAEKNLSKLFSIDEQIKHPGTMNEKGTGLGLILCKEFVEANKGTIAVKSELGKGSTFSISLPHENH